MDCDAQTAAEGANRQYPPFQHLPTDTKPIVAEFHAQGALLGDTQQELIGRFLNEVLERDDRRRLSEEWDQETQAVAPSPIAEALFPEVGRVEEVVAEVDCVPPSSTAFQAVQQCRTQQGDPQQENSEFKIDPSKVSKPPSTPPSPRRRGSSSMEMVDRDESLVASVAMPAAEEFQGPPNATHTMADELANVATTAVDIAAYAAHSEAVSSRSQSVEEENNASVVAVTFTPPEPPAPLTVASASPTSAPTVPSSVRRTELSPDFDDSAFYVERDADGDEGATEGFRVEDLAGVSEGPAGTVEIGDLAAEGQTPSGEEEEEITIAEDTNSAIPTCPPPPNEVATARGAIGAAIYESPGGRFQRQDASVKHDDSTTEVSVVSPTFRGPSATRHIEYDESERESSMPVGHKGFEDSVVDGEELQGSANGDTHSQLESSPPAPPPPPTPSGNAASLLESPVEVGPQMDTDRETTSSSHGDIVDAPEGGADIGDAPSAERTSPSPEAVPTVAESETSLVMGESNKSGNGSLEGSFAMSLTDVGGDELKTPNELSTEHPPVVTTTAHATRVGSTVESVLLTDGRTADRDGSMPLACGGEHHPHTNTDWDNRYFTISPKVSALNAAAAIPPAPPTERRSSPARLVQREAYVGNHQQRLSSPVRRSNSDAVSRSDSSRPVGPFTASYGSWVPPEIGRPRPVEEPSLAPHKSPDRVARRRSSSPQRVPCVAHETPRRGNSPPGRPTERGHVSAENPTVSRNRTPSSRPITPKRDPVSVAVNLGEMPPELCIRNEGARGGLGMYPSALKPAELHRVLQFMLERKGREPSAIAMYNRQLKHNMSASVAPVSLSRTASTVRSFHTANSATTLFSAQPSEIGLTSTKDTRRVPTGIHGGARGHHHRSNASSGLGVSGTVPVELERTSGTKLPGSPQVDTVDRAVLAALIAKQLKRGST